MPEIKIHHRIEGTDTKRKQFPSFVEIEDGKYLDFEFFQGIADKAEKLMEIFEKEKLES